MTTWLTDDTWRRLDPRDARLRRGGRRGLALIVVVTALTLGALATGYRSGLLSPRLSVVPDTLTARDGSHTFTRAVDVVNDGFLDERILSVSGAGAGIRIAATSPRQDVVPAGGSIRLTLRYVVTDCASATEEASAAVRLVLDRPWGTISVRLAPDGYTAPDAGVLAQVCATS